MKDKYKKLLGLTYVSQAVENGRHWDESRFKYFREELYLLTAPARHSLVNLIPGSCRTPQGDDYWINLLLR